MCRQFIRYLQALRDDIGLPININSGFRCKTHNTKVGGASSSKHMEGIAADVSCPGLTPYQLASYAKNIPQFKGIGVYSGWVHLDTRSGKRVIW